MKTMIKEFESEYTRLNVRAEQLHNLFTTKISELWFGDAFEAYQRECRDNRELIMNTIDQFKRILELVGHDSENTAELPSDFIQ